MEMLILVDEKDVQTGTCEKMEVHRKGLLHRAFSIFVFNSKDELMLQRRAKTKYHTPGLWTNTCCSHPRDGEKLEEAVHRRLKEEMGFDCDLKEEFSFIYRAQFDNDLVEHEFDHVFIGKYDNEPNPNPGEADNWKWINIEELKKDIKENPDNYTPWFKIAVEELINRQKTNF